MDLKQMKRKPLKAEVDMHNIAFGKIRNGVYGRHVLLLYIIWYSEYRCNTIWCADQWLIKGEAKKLLS